MFKHPFFKRNKITTALLLATASTASFALPPTATVNTVLYIPGSQAEDPNLGFMITDGAGYTNTLNALCDNMPTANGITNGLGQQPLPAGQPNDAHVYFLGGNNNNNSAVFCVSHVANPSGENLLISRRRLGASLVGLDAAQNGTPLTFITPADLAKCTPVAAGASYVSGGVTYNYNYNCTTSTNAPATAGTSDVTPDAWYGADNIAGGLNAAGVPYQNIIAGNFGNVFALGGHIIGITVTLQLRNALQYAESLSGLIPSSCQPGDESAACMPSLSKQQLTSIFSGTISNWSSFQVPIALGSATTKDLVTLVKDAYTAGVRAINQTAIANPTPNWTFSGTTYTNTQFGAPLDSKVHICRREAGAGQQVAMLANIMQNPCLGGADGTSAPSLTIGTGLNDVQYATSLGAVDSCLTDYSSGTNKFFVSTTNNSTAPGSPPNPTLGVNHGNQWAISIQTTERNNLELTNTQLSPYRFIKIEGFAPTGQEAYLGHYTLIGEYSISWNSTNDIRDTYLNALVGYSQLPSNVALRNGNLDNHSWGQGGYVALSANGYPPSKTWTASNPVWPYTRAASGTPDACAIPVMNTGPAGNIVPLQ